MIKKKPTAKQLKARAKFVKMVRAKAKAKKKAKIKGDTIVTYRGKPGSQDKEFLMERDKEGKFKSKLRLAGEISNKKNISRLQDLINQNKYLQEAIEKNSAYVKANKKSLSKQQIYFAKRSNDQYKKEISANKKMITILKSQIK